MCAITAPRRDARDEYRPEGLDGSTGGTDLSVLAARVRPPRRPRRPPIIGEIALLTSLTTFLTHEFPVTPFLVPGLIPGGSGLLILAGLPKAGKTLLSMQLFIALLTGETFLGRPVTPTAATYIVEEGQAGRIQSRLRRLLGDRVPVAGHYVAVRPGLRLDTADGRARFADAVRASGTQVVFVDPLAFVHQLDENANGEMAPMLHALGGLTHDLGVLVVLVHHQAKGAAPGDSRGIRGAGALAGATEGNLMLSRSGGGHRLTVDLRDGEDVALDLFLDRTTLRFRVDERRPVVRERATLADRVAGAFAGSDEAVDVKTLSGRMCLSDTAVATALRELVQAGLVGTAGTRGRSILYRRLTTAETAAIEQGKETNLP